MPSSVKPKTLDKQCAVAGQKVDYVEVIALGPERLRVAIRSDPYQEQCYARIHLFSGGEWKLVHEILPDLMKTPDSLAYGPGDKGEQNFAKDRDQLVKVAKQVLFTN